MCLQLFVRSDGSVMHLVGDDCSQRITLYVAKGKLHVSIQVGLNKPIRFLASRKLNNDQVPVLLKYRTISASKTKLVISVEGKKYTRRYNSNHSDVRHLVAGSLPTASYRCSSDAMELRNSFAGYVFQPALNRSPLRAKRVENVPTIFGGRTNLGGIYLQGTDLELAMPGGVKTISFEMRAQQEPNTIMRLKGKGELEHFRLFGDNMRF